MKSALKVTPKIQADAGVHDPQYLARDFKSSVWVAASAGTGKTKVLIDRVLTLLLEGASPEKILCLTFTKAAAAEMTSRITQRLSAWVIAPTDELKAELETLLGRPVEGDITKRARHLVKEVFGHLKLQTIHSFCQSLLKRFPLESGVSPHFDVLDEGVARLLLEQSEREVLTAPSLKNDIAILTRVMEPGVFKSLMGQIANQRDRFESVVKDGEGAYKTRLNAFLGLMGDETKEGLEKEVLTQFSQSGIYYAKEALGSGSKTDQEKAILLNKWLSVDAENRGSLLGQYESLFFTTKGERRARLCTKGVLNEFPDIEDVLAHEAERLNVLRDRAKALSVATYSEALLKVGQEFLAIYERIKQRRSVLDYNDLIGKSVALLSQKSMTPWVLYKLDGVMDHILIDEAQDTSHSQWQVIGALVEGLLENPGIAPRTMFSVGDEKQSIYSFQGADPQLFKNMRSTFQDRVEQEGQFWKDVDLTVSFRSTEPILQVVDQVFKAPILQQGLGLGQAVSHEVHRTSQAGLVEIWPLAIPIEQESGSAWEVPITRRQADSPRTRLAHRIATQIHGWLESQEILPSQNRPICPGDILILVRRRTEFVEELMRFLKAKGIPVSGLDRMRLLDQLAVMDLMALGEFILLPEDDLNLAVVLKGPLIGLTEEQLFGLCHERSGLSLWAALGQRKGDNPIYGEAHSFLNKLLSMNETLSPYALFATILGKMEGQKKLLSCLGLEASDTIEAFLTHCHTYERRHGLSLQGFLAWFKTSDPEIKRDLDQGGNHVRIMTVHGSKGLQAPIVILPDTTHVPSHPQRLFWPSGEDGGGLMVFSPKKNSDGEVVNDLRSADKSREVHEYFRLLYVAMT
ncbi:MAG: double-strand break repair helicase AddA, partial [Alphaproteobacteria bacterium]|nr:double-strand break repair helicase AddA [Alphaproteobacteria bacterium]